MAYAGSAARGGTGWGPFVLAGVAAGGLAWLLADQLTGSAWALRLVLIGVGLASATVAVVRHPRASGALAGAAVTAFLAGGAIAEPIADRTAPDSVPSTAGAFVLHPLPFEAAEGGLVTAAVASFRDPGARGDAPHYAALVNWGDGAESAGSVRADPRAGYVIEGSHTYAQEGRYRVQVSVSDEAARQATTETRADVTRWDSARLLLRLLAGISAVAAVLVLLPAVVARFVVSLWLIFHFGGIFTAVTNVPGTAPWLSSMLWLYPYRPYLQFMYLNNAYHYYSPDPGPATLVWMRLDYGTHDGHRYWRWVKMPELNEHGAPVRPDGKTRVRPYVEYTRRLSLAESINLGAPNQVPPNYVQLQARRVAAGEERHIPAHPEMLLQLQYRPPTEQTSWWIQSYVRHVAAEYPACEGHPEFALVSVKVYRVIHQLLSPAQFLAGVDPNDPTTYLPFYQGEYDPEGRPTPGSLSDPFYGWLIPIVRERTKGGQRPSSSPAGAPLPRDSWRPEDYVLTDYLKLHAGDVAEPEEKP